MYVFEISYKAYVNPKNKRVSKQHRVTSLVTGTPPVFTQNMKKETLLHPTPPHFALT